MCGHLVSFLFVIRGKIGIFLVIELFNEKSMGHKSSITKSSIIPHSPIIILGNLFDIFTLCRLVWVIFYTLLFLHFSFLVLLFFSYGFLSFLSFSKFLFFSSFFFDIHFCFYTY